MFRRTKTEVLVVGAGPVGMFTALVLARRGICVRIVDEAWRTGAHSFALALHAETIEILEEMGLGDEVRRRSIPVDTVAIYDGHERRMELVLDGPEGGGALAVMRQDDLEDLLEVALRAEGVKVNWQHYVASIEQHPEEVRVRIDRLESASYGYGVAHSETIVARSRTVVVPFVIGADGSQSLVRRALEIPTIIADPPQYFAVFEFKTDADLGSEMRLVLDEHTTNVLWPLPNGFCRWSFEITKDEALAGPREKDRNEVEDGRANLVVVTDEHLRELLAERAPWFHGSIEEVRWRTAVRFSRELADQFGEGRVWLVGDAAHTGGPAGIHSMNAGLMEGQNLADTVVRVVRGWRDLTSLLGYEFEHTARWRFLLGLEQDVEFGPDSDDWVRRNAKRLIASLPASEPQIRAYLAQLAEPAAMAG